MGEPEGWGRTVSDLERTGGQSPLDARLGEWQVAAAVFRVVWSHVE